MDPGLQDKIVVVTVKSLFTTKNTNRLRMCLIHRVWQVDFVTNGQSQTSYFTAGGGSIICI